MESRKNIQTVERVDNQHILMVAEEGISELRKQKGWRNPFVQDFLLKEEVEYVKSSRNLPQYT